MTETSWTEEELDRIGGSQDLEVDHVRADGTPREPVTIWVVRVGDDLYVHARGKVRVPERVIT